MGRRLDRWVEFQEPTEEENDAGEMVATGWQPVVSVQASFSQISEVEKLRSGAVEQRADAYFVVRYSKRVAAINGTHRLRFEGDDWRLTGAKQVGRRRLLEFAAWKIEKPGA